ncbi:MAG: hypothetical protein KAR47_00425, partial [Planctomycetes bacterium]|nr:hypothetical protein [Planctomycetota bacterium]
QTDGRMHIAALHRFGFAKHAATQTPVSSPQDSEPPIDRKGLLGYKGYMVFIYYHADGTKQRIGTFNIV